MIAAVNGGVTIDARPQQQLYRGCRPSRLRRQTTTAESRRGVKAAGVTALAEPRRAYLQQWRDVRSVCHVTITAIVGGWRMFPQEWAALIGVTTVAGFVDGVLDQQLGASRAMRIVAIRAGNFASRDRMG